MGRSKGAKDLRPRKKRTLIRPDPAPVVSLDEFKKDKEKILEEGIHHIVKKALAKRLHADLWEMLNCFRRIKNF